MFRTSCCANPKAMSALGQKQTSRRHLGQVRFAPQSGHARACLDTSVQAHKWTLHRQRGATPSAGAMARLRVVEAGIRCQSFERYSGQRKEGFDGYLRRIGQEGSDRFPAGPHRPQRALLCRPREARDARIRGCPLRSKADLKGSNGLKPRCSRRRSRDRRRS
jgi:hypothetical protein